MAKTDAPELWLGVPAAWVLQPREMLFEARTATLALMCLVCLVSVGFVAQALDDVKGYRDGTDDINYAPGRERRRERKPLIEGNLSERQALVFATGAGFVAVVVGLAIAVVVDFRPLWLVFATAVMAALAIQYSFGFAFSYRLPGGGELVLAVTMASSTVLTNAVLSGKFSITALAIGWLLGTSILQVSVCGSTNDASGDRQAGRRTVAVLTSPAVNRWFVLVLIGQGIVYLFVIVAFGLAPAVLVLFALPALCLQIMQLRAVARDDWLRARGLGFRALRYLGLAVLGSFLVTGGLAWNSN
ncbi:UbiA family prenyltransferase [Nocardia sp. NPDC058658]|uniref:UbiA family prenyltransferase n=1 Tax=Nocardia sp. NPDC058658 TaxID=3346580 RepID=UPI00365D3D98